MRFRPALPATLATTLALALAACAAIPERAERTQRAEQLTAAKSWQRDTLSAGGFALASYHARWNASPGAPLLTVYLEGDGLAWLTSSLPSDDPTPLDPLALRLALADTSRNVAYLARPCQYVDSPACKEAYWTSARFAPELVAATLAALDQLKARAGAQRLRLIGYSGGAAMALLAAARRDDVESIITVAGNLDHRAWTTLLRISPLAQSLNPADEMGKWNRIPQVHFAGADDRTVPASIAQGLPRDARLTTPYRVIVEPGFDHHCCWAERWPALLREAEGTLAQAQRP